MGTRRSTPTPPATSNTANGTSALYANTTGVQNTANGMNALYVNTTGIQNTANGTYALYANTTGYSNTANGYQALYANTTGVQNTANGMYALYANTTGSNNTANGFQALYANTTGYSNTANGYALSNTTGSRTPRMVGALQHHRQQQHREWVQALYANTTGSNNTANGFQALYANTTGSSNTANGSQALYANTTGYSNTANGYQAGQYIADGVTANQTSSNSVYEGFQAYPLADGDTNENVIGNTAIGHGSNTTTLGNTSITDTYIAGSAHIGDDFSKRFLGQRLGASGNLADWTNSGVAGGDVPIWNAVASKWTPGTPLLPTQYTIAPCSVTLTNGGAAIPAATYSTIFKGSCLNIYGTTYTIAHASVYSDNAAGASSCAVTDSASNTVLSASTAANSAWLNNADANINGSHDTAASGVWLNFSIVADGTSNTIKCVLTTTR